MLQYCRLYSFQSHLAYYSKVSQLENEQFNLDCIHQHFERLLSIKSIAFVVALHEDIVYGHLITLAKKFCYRLSNKA
jgi:hypothetical protein